MQDANVKISAQQFIQKNESGSIRDHYKIGQILGQGAFGEVRRCMHRISGANRAVKVLKKSSMDEEEKKMIFTEITNLKGLDHPNILKMYEYFEDDKRFYIITDLQKGGELFDEIVKRGKFTEKDAKMLIK